MAVEQDRKSDQEISVREANQNFSKLIGRVAEGARFLVTKNNRPIARITPIESDEQIAETRREAAVKRLEAMMDQKRCSHDGWTFRGDRDALHDRSL